MSKTFAPNIPKPANSSSGFPWKWIAVAVGLSAVVFVTATIAFTIFVKTATEVVVGTAAAGTELVATFGKVVLEGMDQILLSGADEDRLTILTEIAKVDFSNSDVPSQWYSATKSNLEHENEAIREAAKKALIAMKKSPNIESIQ